MKIEHILEQVSGAQNEDYLISDGDIHGVFRWCHQPGRGRFEHGRSGGLLAASIAGEAFLRNHAPLAQLVSRPTKRSGRAWRSASSMCRGGARLWSASAAVVRCALGRGMVSDRGRPSRLCRQGRRLQSCGPPSGPRLRDPTNDQGARPLPSRRPRANRNGAPGDERDYGVLNGEDAAEDFFRSGLEPLDNIRSVLLSTGRPGPAQCRARSVQDFSGRGAPGPSVGAGRPAAPTCGPSRPTDPDIETLSALQAARRHRRYRDSSLPVACLPGPACRPPRSWRRCCPSRKAR